MKLFGMTFSRRTLFQKAGLTAGVGLLDLAATEDAHSQISEHNRASGKPRALALIGDRYHNPDYIRVSLDKVFKELNIPIDYTIQYDQISRSLLKNYQLFLCLRDGMIWPDGYLGPDAYTSYEHDLENPAQFSEPKPETWMTEEQGAAIKDFVNAGNGFYALHNCSHISLSSKNYRDVMGGAYVGHPPLRPFRVRASENKHPITQGIGEFMVNDEQHYVDFDKDRKHIILEAENIDGLVYENHGPKSIAGWAYDFGKGRVVFTAAGHTIHAMWVLEYLEVQKRSVRWLLKQI
jgi:type 1 glutamine amidotransferase